MSTLENVAQAIRKLSYEDQMTMAEDFSSMLAEAIKEEANAVHDTREIASLLNNWARDCLDIIENEKPLT